MSTVKLQVARGSEATERQTETYEVPFVEGMSLLDALFWIREHKDSTLAVRYSCRSANACKECMAHIDGKAAYLCSVRAKADSEVRIEPLSARPWIKDLTTVID